MSEINISVPHSLSYEEARQRAQRFISRMKAEYPSLTARWDGDLCAFAMDQSGASGTGTVHVQEEKIIIRGNIELSFPASLVVSASDVRQRIQQKAEEVFA